MRSESTLRIVVVTVITAALLALWAGVGFVTAALFLARYEGVRW